MLGSPVTRRGLGILGAKHRKTRPASSAVRPYFFFSISITSRPA
jgi:hypothetical protein